MMPRRAILAAPSILGVALVLGSYIQTAGHPSEMLRPLVVIALAALAVTLFAWALVRRMLAAVWVGLVVVSWILGRELAWLPIGVGLAVIATERLRQMRGRSPLPVPAAMVLGPPLALCGVAMYQLMAVGVIAPDDFKIGGPPRVQAASTRELPSLYVLLLDGYPRADELGAEFGYDNSRFLSQLERLGFRLPADATSSFGGTSWTLASTMLEDSTELHPYADIDSTPDLWATLRDLRRRYLVDVPMMDRLREAGYRLDYTDAGVDLSAWRGWDRTHDSGQVSDTEALLIQRSPIAGLLAGWVMDQLRARVDDSLNSWVVTSGDASQKVSFAHIMPPHAPFLWGEGGTSLKPGECWFRRVCSLYTVIAADLGMTREQYGNQLGWQLDALNAKVIMAVKRVVTADPHAAVIVMSDHGSRFEPFSVERLHTFLAARIPHEPDLLAVDPGPDALFVRLLESVSP